MNVLGDAFGVGIVAHLSQKELEKPIRNGSIREIGDIVSCLSHSDLTKLRDSPVFDKSVEMKVRRDSRLSVMEHVVLK